MPDIIESQASGDRRDVLFRYKDMGDGTYAMVVATVGAGGGSGSSVDRELVVSTYRCKTAFSGASVGDTITATQVIDVSATPTVVATIWRNQTTAADLGSAPAAVNLELVGSNALTDAQLRASAVATAPNITRGGGVVDANTQRVTLATDGPVVTAVGQTADAAASSDTGAFSILAFLKRGLQNWTTLLSRVPAQAIAGMMPVDTLANLGQARQLAAASTSANTALTTTCRRVSVYARLADIRFAVGTGVQTASASTHFIAQGERLDFDVPANAQIAVIRAGTVDGVLEVSELT